ncbi:restriction endonuclease subunit S [Vibrio lentus]|uniref:restriction endonuclease subunit S n=1 Tax=Vibrio lentus TaxID=136468 RepID=UPI000C85B7B9|nr:restriction endonuclease subunit S [Vibrio lentus]MCC5487643.1 restriction endonuclease subunit S [Vibrio lentus]MCC5492694.1 restriction endonuclease subunit S [Vibrio lentus]PMJ50959.1 hypothetical protein BCU20_10175 [Vibrio lentus]
MSWPLVKLGEVAPSKALKNPVVVDDDNVWQLNLDMVESGSGRILKKSKAPLSEAGSSTHWFDDRNVLYSKLRPYLNKVVLPDEEGLATTELVPMLPDPKRLDRRYLVHYLRSKQFVSWISDQVAGAKMPRVSMKVFWDHEIPLPPVEEQKRIAAILDKADAIRQKRKQAIDLADEFLRSVFLDMFGDPVTNPKGWEVKMIEKLAAKDKYSIKAGPFGSALKKEDYAESGYKIYGQEQVIRDDLDFGDYFIDQSKYESLKSCAVSPGDMLISLVGSFGKISVVPEEYSPGIINPRLMKVKFDTKLVNPLFMKFLLTSKEMLRKIESMSHGGTMGILNVGKMKGLEVIVPPLVFQENFLKLLVRVDVIKGTIGNCEEPPLFDALSQKAFSDQL